VQAAGGGYKPEGAWAFQRKTATVKTIAEWVPATKRALADAAQLEGLINDELRADIAETEENQILTGNGTGENLTGILSTSGIQTQAFDTDIFVSTRKALTKARTVGRVVPNAIALNPVDVEKVDLARESGTGKFFSGGPFAMGPRTLWGTPILETEGVAAGTGLVGDFSKAVLWDREQTSVSITDSHADFFIRNLVAILAEERVAFGVTRPTAFVSTAVA
jgi:HK97 family phage major capsid protein